MGLRWENGEEVPKVPILFIHERRRDTGGMGWRWETGEEVPKIPILKEKQGSPGGSAGLLALPPAQGVIPEIRDRVPHQTPCMEPASPSACVFASLSL